jgi:hypothetical protein
MDILKKAIVEYSTKQKAGL